MFSSEFLQRFLIYIHVNDMPPKFSYLHYCRLKLFSVIDVQVSKKLQVLLAAVCNSCHQTPAEEKIKRKQYSNYSMSCIPQPNLPPSPSQQLSYKWWQTKFGMLIFIRNMLILNIHLYYYTVKPTPCHPERLLIYWLTFGFKCPPCIETRYKSVPFIWNLSLAWSCHCSHRHQNAKPLLTFQHYNWGLLPHCVWGGNS